MNKDEIVAEMVSYIEETERESQASAFVRDSKVQKNSIVNSILSELEKKVKDEDTQD